MVNLGLSKVDDAVAAKHPVGLLSFIQYFYLLLLKQVILNLFGVNVVVNCLTLICIFCAAFPFNSDI